MIGHFLVKVRWIEVAILTTIPSGLTFFERARKWAWENRGKR